MANEIKLLPLSEIIARIHTEKRARIENTRKYIEKDATDLIARVESTRQAIMLLDAEGYEMDFQAWEKGDKLTIDLKFFASTKTGKAAMAEAITKVRRCLGAKRFKVKGTQVANAEKKIVEVLLECDEFPGVTIRYQRKLAKDAKCKIVRERRTSTSLVCNM